MSLNGSLEEIRLAALKLSVESAGGLTEDQIFKRAHAFAEFIMMGYQPAVNVVMGNITVQFNDSALRDKFLEDQI